MKTVADVIIEVLEGRGGFDHWWHGIEDADIQRDIKKALNKAVNNFSGNKPEVVKNNQTEKP